MSDNTEMQTKVVQVATGYKLPQIGDCFAGGTVKWVSMPSRSVVVEMTPDQFGALDMEPSVMSHRDEKIMGIANWDPRPLDWETEYVHGDTFPLIGLTDDVLKRARYGEGVIAGVGDTGCDFGHEAFQGKDCRGDNGDSHGHGTHVSSTAASSWGIAPDAVLYVKKLLAGQGGTGTESDIAAGLHTFADTVVGWRANAVLNLSLGGGVSSIMDDATRYVSSRGIWVAAAAGNSGPSATIGSPARAADFVLGAVDRSFTIASFSSGGGTWTQISCYMPGVDIVAAAANSGNGTLSASGTSMATPHMMGVLVLLRAAGMSLAEARAYLAAHMRQIGGTTNSKGVFILQPDFGQAEPPPSPPPPPDNPPVEDRSAASLVSEAKDWSDIIVDNATNGLYWPTVENAHSIHDLLERAVPLLEGGSPPAPAPTPTPTPTPPPPPPSGRATSDPLATLKGFSFDRHWAGSVEGDKAVDWYPDPTKSGKSEDMPISMPVGGTVKKVSQIGPLKGAAAADCQPDADGLWLPEGTALNTAIWIGDDGYVAAFTHIRADVLEGRAEKNEIFAYTDSSGLESFKQAGMQPGHIHVAFGNKSTLPSNWNGDMADIPAVQFFQHYGFQVEIRPYAQECGPADYQAGHCQAGVKR